MVDQAIILTIVLALVCVLIFTRISPVRAFAGSLVACYLLGFVHTETVLAKGTNEGVITLVLLLLVSVGLERLPWLVTLSERMLSPSVTRSLLGLSLTTAMFSAFINNTAVYDTLESSIRKNKVLSPSRLLLPQSY
ncbi:MAG: SLC13 family permease, partial [Halieaceae bacterium]